MPLDANSLLGYVDALDNRQLVTLARKKPFNVRATPDGIEIIPASKHLRRVSREKIQRLCNEYTHSKSMKPGDYKAVSFDASYLLAVVDGFLHDRR